ncbi:MAG: methyltransferase [Ornithinimicrobium sp.]
MASDAGDPPGNDHYFTADPASDDELRFRTVTLAGREVRVVTAGGIFSPDSVDKGTAVLLKHLPLPPVSGTFLDLGCGWGPLALTMALQAPSAQVHAVDVNRRALDLMRRNAVALGCSGVQIAEPCDVPGDTSFDLIWSNPAIRIGKAALHDMLLTWLPRLAPGGSAYLVVSKNLGADSLQTWLSGQDPRWQVERHASDKGFRILRIHLPPTRPAA